MSLPMNCPFKAASAQESDYGSELGMLRRAPTTTSAHPLEESERTYYKRQEEQRLSSASRAFGIGFSLHAKHERAAAGCRDIGHMEFLPRSNAHLQALTGRDLTLDFTDTLGVMPEVTVNPQLCMERQQKKRML
ncbi:uncharacterized protein LOC126994544 [Eriocheir sinensis]|uniref:uncharacterized protein LOC126992047 n=1 Tax=Eriocheir sinensis TaxID=95602 RepID=UPI0021C942CB|nr:uncharacterized protein LOC126992047 [Eriocheir sinensis]XP_050709834.1 uncharacterized protein LOC126994544 [Eriocheir sinensis]